MKKFNYLLGATLALASALTMSSCDDDDINVDDLVDNSFHGAILVNEGSYGYNNANLTLYSKDGTVSAPATLQGMGETANDALLASDGKVYVAITGSNAIAIASITSDAVPYYSIVKIPYQPRYLAEYGQWIYISCYGGYLVRLNKESASVDQKIKLEGAYNLEGVAVMGDTLYVCNSYKVDEQYNYIYLDDILSYSLKDSEQGPSKKTFVNPNRLTVMNDKLFVLGFGNYADIPSQLGYVDIQTGETTFIANATRMCKSNGMLLFANCRTTYSADWKESYTDTSFGMYDPMSGQVLDNPLPKLPEALKTSTVYFMSTNPKNGETMIGVSDYSNTSTIYHVGQDGTLIREFDSKGINTNNAIFLN